MELTGVPVSSGIYGYTVEVRLSQCIPAAYHRGAPFLPFGLCVSRLKPLAILFSALFFVRRYVRAEYSYRTFSVSASPALGITGKKRRGIGGRGPENWVSRKEKLGQQLSSSREKRIVVELPMVA